MAGLFRTHKSFLQTNAWQHQNLNALRYNTSQAGSVVPWMDGTTRVAVNLIDFGNYRGPGGGGKKGKGVGPLPVGGTNSSGGFKGGGGGKGKGGGKKGKGNQDFSVDVAFGICQGPVTIAPTSFVWSSAGVAGFMSVGLNAYSGADGQTADHVMAGLHPPPAIGYSGTCYVTGTPMDLGMSPVIPNLSFEPAGPNAGTGGPQFPRDANPSHVVRRFLCDPRDGADFPLANLDPLIDTLYGDYCVALGLVVSPLLTGQTQAQEWLGGLAKLTNTAIVWSGNLLKFIPHGDVPLNSNGTTWTPNLVPEYSLTDDDFLDWHASSGQLGQAEENQDDPILLTRSNPADAVNWLTIEYLDRSNFYNSTTLPAFDQGAVDTYGRRTGDNLNGHAFCNAGGAQVSAQLALQRQQYIRNTYKFKLGWKYALLEPMDIVLLSGRCGDLYLDIQPVRLTAIEEDENGDLTIEAEEIQVALPTCQPTVAAAAAPPPATCGSHLGQTTAWNPLAKNAALSLSNSNFTWTLANAFGGAVAVRSTGVSHSTGKWYFVAHIDMTDAANGLVLGLGNSAAALDSYPGNTASVGFFSGNTLVNGVAVGLGSPEGTVGYMVGAVDLDAHLFWGGLMDDNCHNLHWGPGADPSTGTGGADISSIQIGAMLPIGGGFADGRQPGLDPTMTLFTRTLLSDPTLAGFTPWDG